MPKTADEFKVHIDLKEVNAALQKLPLKMRKKAVTNALRFASNPLKAAVKKNARSLSNNSSGALADSVGMRVSRRGRGKKRYISSVWVGPMRNNTRAFLKYLSFYGIKLSRENVLGGIRHGHLVEFGHLAKDGTQVPAQPFIYPAFTSTKFEIGQRFKRRLGADVEKIIKDIRKEAST